MPTDGQLKRALELVGRGQTQYRYFFGQLDDPSWIGPLSERGFFERIPEPVQAEAGWIHPHWPEADFLMKVVDRAPAGVAQVLSRVELTDNTTAVSELCQIAAKLPPAEAAGFAKRLGEWLTPKRSLPALVPEMIGRLIVGLAEGGEVEQALALSERVLAVHALDSPGLARARVAASLDAYEYRRVSEQVLGALASPAGFRAVDLAARLLAKVLEIGQRGDAPHDYSYIWRPSIRGRAGYGDEIADALNDGVRDTALAYVDHDPGRLEQTASDLRGRGWHVLTRIALYLLAEQGDLAPATAADWLLDPDLFHSQALAREYEELLAKRYELLDEDQQEAWLSMVESGPKWPTAEDAAREDIDDQTRNLIVATWQRDHLATVEPHLPAAWRARLGELTERYGAAESHGERMQPRTWVGPTSPLTDAELADMRASEIVAFLASWKQSGDPMSPSPEGLGRSLARRIEQKPEDFFAQTNALAELDTTYVRAAIDGFGRGLKADRGVDWGAVLPLIEATVRAPALEGEASQREGRGQDPDWRGARRQAASLIGKALAGDQVPAALAEATWEALEVLAWDPEPDPQHERDYGGDNMDPLTISLNTVRGAAMHAVVEFASWLKRRRGSEFRLEDAPQVRALIDEHLDPSREPAQAVRGVFGSRLHQLQWVDRDWLEQRLELLFPEASELAPLHDAAWESYLSWGSPNRGLFALLRGQYRRAVEGLSGSDASGARAGRDPAVALAEHLAIFLWWGAIAPDDELVVGFFANADGEQAAHLVSFLGRSLGAEENQPVDEEVLDRLKAAWTQIARLAAGRSDGGVDVLAAFGDWYAAAPLEADWVNARLIETLEAGATPAPDFLVFQRLVTVAKSAPAEAVRIALILAERVGADGWGLFAHRRDFAEIARSGLAADEATRAEARRLIDRLVAKGLVQARSLLQEVEQPPRRESPDA
jgi:hypothetical protein